MDFSLHEDSDRVMFRYNFLECSTHELMTERDLRNQMAYALEKGREEGRKEGREEARRIIMEALRKKGLSDEEIVKLLEG